MVDEVLCMYYRGSPVINCIIVAKGITVNSIIMINSTSEILYYIYYIISVKIQCIDFNHDCLGVVQTYQTEQ